LGGNFVGKKGCGVKNHHSSSHVIFVNYEYIFTEKKITGLTFWAAFKQSDAK